MSIALLTQAYEEVRRLSIAGSAAAQGDFRLKKLAAPLEQAGQKAPVFAKVAQAISKLVESNEKSSPEAILDLSTLINAILYTQGETGAPGKLTPLETTDLGAQQTQATARVLKPLLEALSNTGSGRLEVIKDAHARGVFRDLRLVKPALAALDDNYAEIADWVAENVLPQYGKAILPELRSKFDPKSRGGNVRRLTLIHTLDPTGARELVKQALEEGSKEVKVAAIECLGDSTEDLQFLLDQAKAKAKEIRAAALKALGKSNSDQAVGVFLKAIEGDDIDIAIAPIRASNSPKLKKLVLEAARSHFDALLTTKVKDKAELGKLTQRMLSLLECLRGRTDRQVDEFLAFAFEHRRAVEAIKGEPSGNDVRSRVIAVISEGPTRSRELLINSHATLENGDLIAAFLTACQILTPAKVFDMFSPYYVAVTGEKKSKRAPADHKQTVLHVLLSQIVCVSRHPLDRAFQCGDVTPHALDPRWLDLAVERKDLLATMNIAMPAHPGAYRLLHDAFEEQCKKPRSLHETADILRTMIRIEHPKAIDAVITVIGMLSKSNQGFYWLTPLIDHLPKEAAPQLEALLPGLPDKVVDQLLDHITELKNKP